MFLGIVVAVVFGGALLWGLIPHSGISWQVHLFGGVGGLLAAEMFSVRRGSCRLTPTGRWSPIPDQTAEPNGGPDVGSSNTIAADGEPPASVSVSQERWTAVDRYITDLLVGEETAPARLSTPVSARECGAQRLTESGQAARAARPHKGSQTHPRARHAGRLQHDGWLAKACPPTAAS